MALIFPNMPCSLCRCPVDTSGPFFASSAATDDENNSILKHSDAVIHWNCLFAWDGLDRFLQVLYRSDQRFFEGNRFWRVVHQDDRFRIAVNYEKASIDINRTPCHLHILLDDYPQALLGLKRDQTTEYYDPHRLALLRTAIDDIVAAYPILEPYGQVPEVVLRQRGNCEQAAASDGVPPAGP